MRTEFLVCFVSAGVVLYLAGYRHADSTWRAASIREQEEHERDALEERLERLERRARAEERTPCAA